MNIISSLEAETGRQDRRKAHLPEFSPGEHVRVKCTRCEGNRTRVTGLRGVCIARSGGGINESFTFARFLPVKA